MWRGFLFRYKKMALTLSRTVGNRQPIFMCFLVKLIELVYIIAHEGIRNLVLTSVISALIIK